MGRPIRNNGESELLSAFYNVSAYQLLLSTKDIFVRGAIAMGEHYMCEDIVFGKALIDAYCWETEKACFPRIILSKEVAEYVESHKKDKTESPFSKYFLNDEDFDKQIFVNYLMPYYDYPLPLDLVDDHKHWIIKNLEKYRSKPKIWVKYAWVAKYHNRFVRNNTNLFSISIPLYNNHKNNSPEDYLISTEATSL